MSFVGAIAERLVGREATAADADSLASAEAVGLSLGVYKFEIGALYAEGAVAENGEFGGHIVKLWSDEVVKRGVLRERRKVVKLAAGWPTGGL
jgi:hypothetical protein